MAASDQMLAMGLVWGVMRELGAINAQQEDRFDGAGHPALTAYLLIQQVVIAAQFSDSARGFLYMLCMPIGLYKLARVLTFWAAALWFFACGEWWKRHTPEWRGRVTVAALWLGLIAAGGLIFGVDNGCNRGQECPGVE